MQFILTYKSMQKLLILLLFVSIGTSLDCAPIISGNGSSSLIPQFQSNTANLQFSNQESREYLFNVTLKNTTTGKPYQIVVCPSYIENYFDPANLDFSVRATTNPTYFTVSFIINQLANWTSFHIHYIATGRDDIRAGNFIINNPNLLVAENNTDLIQPRLIQNTYYFGEKKWNASTPYASVRAYISGIKYRDRFIDIGVELSKANTTTSLMTVILNITNQKYSIEALHIGYVMYAQVNSPLVITFVSLIQSFLQKSIDNHLQNQFVGIIKLTSKKLSSFFSKKRLLVTTPVGPTPILSIDRSQITQFIDAFQQEGMLVDIMSNQMPTIGQSAQNINLPNCTTYNGCLKLGGSVITQQKQQKCILCQNNSFYDPNLQACVCNQQYFRDPNNTCISYASLCKPNQIYMPGGCYILSSQILIVNCTSDQYYNITTKKCQCIIGYSPYLNQEGKVKCFLPCTKNKIFDIRKQKCICQPEFLDKNEVCISCSNSFSKWNAVQKICQCLPGSAMYLDVCTKCDDHSIYDTKLKRCVCNPGYGGIGVICRKNPITQPATGKATSKGFTIVFADGSN